MNLKHKHRNRNRRGAAAVLAMLFLVLMSTLCVAMLGTTSSNLQSASGLSDVARAQDAAESGLRWMQFRFLKMQRPKTTVGNITSSVATMLWPTLRQAIIDDFSKATINGQTNWNQLQNIDERAWTVGGSTMTSSLIRVEDTSARFQLEITPHPLGAGDPLDARYIRVSSTGTYRSATRSVGMDFKIDKKIKFAVVGKVPIQLGRNTIVEGPVAMANPVGSPGTELEFAL